MYISKVNIENYKCFKGRFTLPLNRSLNILVGDNDVGKSTVIEAINLCLTGLLNGKHLRSELNEHLFNNNVVKEYLESIKSETLVEVILPPTITIEVFIDDIDDDACKALFEGNGNSDKKKACGLFLKIELNETHRPLYEELIKNNLGEINSIPIEYYDFFWSSFARDENLTPLKIPLKPALIDSSGNRYQNGSDIYISRIVRDNLVDSEKIAVSQAYRQLQDSFSEHDSIKGINDKLKDAIGISDKKINLSINLSSKSAWETTLTTYLDNVPFHYIGKGEQTLVKTRLALSHKRTQEANILLIEEPENHLSYTKLNKLIGDIKNPNINKQIIVSTHSSFVANKLGLGDLILFSLDKELDTRECMPFNDLSLETREYFEKLAGYDTLRLVLCRSAILVEGDSDELVVSKAYQTLSENNLPIQNEREVISVGTAFLRFLEVALKLKKKIAVITDTDGDIQEKIENKYKEYLNENRKEFIGIYYDPEEDSGDLKIGKNSTPFNYNTLEPKLVKVNGLDNMNKILGKTYTSVERLHSFMLSNKTECALRIFKTTERIVFPQFIIDAIKFINE